MKHWLKVTYLDHNGKEGTKEFGVEFKGAGKALRVGAWIRKHPYVIDAASVTQYDVWDEQGGSETVICGTEGGDGK